MLLMPTLHRISRKILTFLVVFALPIGVLASLLTNTNDRLVVEAAGSASIYPSPAATTIYKGNSVIVSVITNTGGKKTNAYQATVRYPTDKLQAVGISKGSLCPVFWIKDPSYNNSTGTASFECGTNNPYNGSAGVIGSITFRAINTGTATISVVSPSQVLAADGSGTNVLGSTGSRSITINEPPKGGPAISSSSHPSQEEWYSNNLVEFSWQGGAGALGTSIDFNQIAGSIPDEVEDTTNSSKSYENVDDGIWYFHARTRFSNVWSTATHYRVQIDKSPPEEFIPTIEPEGISDTPTPTVYFVTSDATSGIKHYEVRVDDGEYVVAESPYQLPAQRSGTHVVTVKAVDHAGNETIGKVEAKIKEITAPSITVDPTEVLFGEEITISGSTIPGGKVKIFLDNRDQLLAEVEADESGNFTYTISAFRIVPWEHEIFATVLEAATGLESASSESQTVKILLSSIRLGNYIIEWQVFLIGISLLALLLLGLLILFFLLIRRRRQNKLHEKIVAMKKEVEADFTRIEADVAERVHDKSAAQLIQDELIQEVREIESELDDIDPKVKHKHLGDKDLSEKSKAEDASKDAEPHDDPNQSQS